MFGIGMPEMLVILALALIIIGPKKLPDLAKSLGRALGEFRRATDDLKSSLDANGDIKEVKDTFDGMRNDIRSAMTVDPQDLYQTDGAAAAAEHHQALQARHRRGDRPAGGAPGELWDRL